MECLVCHARWAGAGACPQCGYDATAPGAREQRAILAARERFHGRVLAHDPDSRVTRRDRMVPWLALGLGLLIFVVWLASCRILY